jgi:hypothetical protein
MKRAWIFGLSNTTLLACMGLATLGGATAMVGCSGDPKPAGPPNVQLQKFQPQGCGFEIATRADYPDFQKGQPVVSGMPDIRRVRLGLGGSVDVGAAGHADPATSIAIAWQTDVETLATNVQWGKTPDPTTWPAENKTEGVTFIAPESLISPQGDDRIHETYLCGLEPGTTYYYRVGGGPAGKEVWSDVYSFTTTPKDGNTEVTLGISGDSRGQDNEAWRLINMRMMQKGVTAQLFSGDMINFATDHAEWHKWLDLAWKDSTGNLSALGQILMLATHGNHENHTLHFYSNLVMPQDPKYPKYSELFFSVDIGPVHVIVLDDFWITSPTGDPEYGPLLKDWLEKDLTAANANRANVPWIVVNHHHAEFSASSHGEDSDVLLGRQFFVPIWDKHHVDFVALGHDHNYERTKPVSGPLMADTLEPVVQDSPAKGTVYMVCAGAGADAYGNGTKSWTETSRTFDSKTVFGFYSFLTANKTTLTLESRELTADATDSVIDTMTITK